MLPIGPMLLMTLTSTSAAVGSVRLELDECIPSRDLVSDLVSIELGFDRVVDHGGAAIEVRSACDADFVRVSITRDRPVRGSRDMVVLDIAERRISLNDVRREGGPRLVALNIAELVNDTPMVALAPIATTSRGPTVSAPVSPPPASTMAIRIGAAPIVRLLPSPDRIAVGVRASANFDAPTDGAVPWTFGIDGGVEQSTAGLRLGDITTRVVSLAALGGVEYVPFRDLSMFLTGGLRGGWVWIDVRADDTVAVPAGNGSGPWFGPMMGARIRYGDRVGVGLGIEGGWTTAGVFGETDGARTGLVDGWLGADLTIDWRLGAR